VCCFVLWNWASQGCFHTEDGEDSAIVRALLSWTSSCCGFPLTHALKLSRLRSPSLANFLRVALSFFLLSPSLASLTPAHYHTQRWLPANSRHTKVKQTNSCACFPNSGVRSHLHHSNCRKLLKNCTRAGAKTARA